MCVKERHCVRKLGVARVAVQREARGAAGGAFVGIDAPEAHRARAFAAVAQLDQPQLGVPWQQERVQLVGVSLIGLEERRLTDRLHADRIRVAQRQVVVDGIVAAPACGCSGSAPTELTRSAAQKATRVTQPLGVVSLRPMAASPIGDLRRASLRPR